MSDIRDYMTLVEQADAESVEQDEERTLTEDSEVIEITTKDGKIGSFKQGDDMPAIRKAIRAALEKYAAKVSGAPRWVRLSCCSDDKTWFTGKDGVDEAQKDLIGYYVATRANDKKSRTDEQADAEPPVVEYDEPQPVAEAEADEGPALTRRDFAEKFKAMEAAKLTEQSGETAPKLTGYSEVVEAGGEPLSVQRFEEYFSETEAAAEPVTESAADDAAARRRFAEAFNEE